MVVRGGGWLMGSVGAECGAGLQRGKQREKRGTFPSAYGSNRLYVSKTGNCEAAGS